MSQEQTTPALSRAEATIVRAPSRIANIAFMEAALVTAEWDEVDSMRVLSRSLVQQGVRHVDYLGSTMTVDALERDLNTVSEGYSNPLTAYRIARGIARLGWYIDRASAPEIVRTWSWGTDNSSESEERQRTLLRVAYRAAHREIYAAADDMEDALAIALVGQGVRHPDFPVDIDPAGALERDLADLHDDDWSGHEDFITRLVERGWYRPEKEQEA